MAIATLDLLTTTMELLTTSAGIRKAGAFEDLSVGASASCVSTSIRQTCWMRP